MRISPDMMNVGQNFIVDKRENTTTTRDGNHLTTKWYLFRIPVEQYERREGNISDFSSIRFMRMFMTGFEKPVVLRFATLNLVHGEWRSYEQSLYANHVPDVSGNLSVSAVSFEENNEKHRSTMSSRPASVALSTPVSSRFFRTTSSRWR